MSNEIAAALRELSDDAELLWNVARRAIEDELIEWRDARRFVLRNNGLVVKERDGTDSSIVRFGPETAVRIGLRALADHLDATTEERMSNELHETDMPPTPIADNAANSDIEAAPVSEGLAEALALLGQHQQGFREHRRPAFYCTGCDWTAVVVANGCDSNGVTIEDQHRAHVAAVIAHGWLPGVIRAAEARALREAAAAMAENSSLMDGSRRPDQYSDARDDERVDNVLWLRDRADRIDQP